MDYGKNMRTMTPYKNKLPSTNDQWLTEIAIAYRDAYETLPYGILVGQKLKPEDLFHLGPVLCLKFRGIKNSKQNLKNATEAALTSYVATKDNMGELFDIPQMSFAFSYIASHFGLDIIGENKCSDILDFIEQNIGALIESTKHIRQ